MTNALLFLHFLWLISIPKGSLPIQECESWLSKTMVQEVVGVRADNLQVLKNPQQHPGGCNLSNTAGSFDPFSDMLILIISEAAKAEAARASLRQMAKGHEKDFQFGWPEQIGDLCLRYLQPDPLSPYRVGFNISFIHKAWLIELKYFSVDDGRNNKFIQTILELESIALLMASRM